LAHIDPVAESSEDEEVKSAVLEPEGSPKTDASSESDSDEDPSRLKTATTNNSLSESTVNNILPLHYHVQMPNLPPIPHAPMEPTALDLTPYPDKSAQKIAQKEHDRQMKTYKQAMKDRDSAIKDRAKLEAKMRKAAAKEILKRQKEEEKTKGKAAEGKKSAEREEDTAKESSKPKQSDDISTVPKSFTTESSGNTILAPPPSSSMSNLSLSREGSSLAQTESRLSQEQSRDSGTGEKKPEKKKKDRVFCMLPPKNQAGERDPAWVRVYMEGVDEVGAHCGLFFVSETYERLVGDVAGRVEEWVREDMTRRFLEENRE